MTHQYTSRRIGTTLSELKDYLIRQQERYYDRDFALVALYCNCLLSIHRLGG